MVGVTFLFFFLVWRSFLLDGVNDFFLRDCFVVFIILGLLLISWFFLVYKWFGVVVGIVVLVIGYTCWRGLKFVFRSCFIGLVG